MPQRFRYVDPFQINRFQMFPVTPCFRNEKSLGEIVFSPLIDNSLTDLGALFRLDALALKPCHARYVTARFRCSYYRSRFHLQPCPKPQR